MRLVFAVAEKRSRPLRRAVRFTWGCYVDTRNHALPDFAIVGCSRSGTTSLFRYLEQHPLVISSIRKEIHFFDRDKNYLQGERWYRAHFPTRRMLARSAAEHGQRSLTGEATPDYLFYPRALQRMASLCSKETRLIVLLRNPVDRAYSDYQNNLRKGVVSLSFAEMVRPESETFPPFPARSSHAVARGASKLLRRGIYVAQLQALDRYLPENPKLILFSEKFFANPQATLDGVTDFLGLPPFRLPDASARNQIRYSEPLKPDLRAALEKFFEPHNRELAAYLGTELPWKPHSNDHSHASEQQHPDDRLPN